MKPQNNRTFAGKPAWFATAVALVAAWAPVDQIQAQALQTKDVVSNRPAVFRGGSVFTADGLGHTGSAGDSAADFGPTGSGPVLVEDASFLNEAAANNELTIAFWAKDYNVSDSSGFWARTAASGGTRGFQAHIPWSNNHIYFDSAGCCGADTRIEADVATFPNYSGDVAWWADWHLFVFSKKGDDKQIWIDGTLFLGGTGTAALPTDFTQIYIGSDGNSGGLYHGLIDDFMVFRTQLIDTDIAALASGTLPTALPAETGLMAYWNFNDPPSDGQFTTVLPTPDTKTAAPDLVRIVHVDGGIPWDANSAKLKVDDVPVTTTFSKNGGTVTIDFVPNPLFAIASKHKASLSYPSAGQTKTLEWTFVVGPYTRDSVASRIGALTRGSGFTQDTAGHSGLAGDYGVDFGRNGTGPIVVGDASFLNAAAANDEMSFGFWAKKYDIAAGSAFWAVSPSSNNAERGWQAHVPWSDSTIYFDTAGCCAGSQRLNANISTFPNYSGDVSWWQDWHYFVFSKKLDNKQIWIDGTLFLEGTGAAPLPQDFTRLMIGSDNAGGGLFHAVIDDFAVFSTQLVDTDIAAIVSGTKPSALPAEAGLVAYWDFNDIPADGIFLSLVPAEDAQDAVPNAVKVVHLQGPVGWDLSKVSLKVDNASVNANVVREDGKVTVSYSPTSLFAPKSTHTVELTYPGAGNVLLTKSWSFTVGSYSKDVLHNYVGTLEGAAKFSEDGGGRSGAPGDLAVDLGQNQAGQSVHILDASFLNEAAANDELAIAGWQKLYAIHDSAFVWGVSPSSDGASRGWGTHTPWSNNNLYFDTAGCCAGDQRLSGPITGFAPYAEVGDVSWWNSWHYFVFQKKLGTKEIWIDGQLFLTGENLRPLPTDFTEAYVGYDPADNARLQGLVDDIAVFKTALTADDITALAGGASPTSLSAEAGLIALWDFNDDGQPRLTMSIARVGQTLNLSWSGGTGPYTLQRKTDLSDAWQTVSTGAETTATIPISSAKGFFRVISQ